LPPCRAQVAVAFFVLALGCGWSEERPAPTAAPDAAAEVSAPPGNPHLLVRRAWGWPGGGLALAIERTGADSLALGLEAGAAPTLALPGRADLPLAATPLAVESGLTALVLVPAADAAEHGARVQAALALAEALPPGERLALWQSGSPPLLLADLDPRRELAVARLAGLAPEPEVEPELDPVLVGLSEAEGSGGALARDVVVVAGSGALSPEARAGPVALWRLGGGGEPVKGGKAAAAALAWRRSHLIGLGACPPGPLPGAADLLLAGERSAVAPPPPLLHLAGEPCQSEAAASFAFPWLERVELALTPAEQKVWDARAKAMSEKDFSTRVRLGAGDWIEATAHFRGFSSLACERKSLTVNLSGHAPRPLMPGASWDRFHLISLCLDSGYFNLAFANRLLRRLGLFGLDQRFVRLEVAGQNRGVYLLLEHGTHTLAADRLAVKAIIRRRFDPEDKPEDVKLPEGAAAASAMLASYHELTELAAKAPADSVGDELAKRMDLDAYLDWLAFMSLFEVGDYVDEVIFIGSAEAGGLTFRVSAWDTDDLFEPCHHGGKWALPDPHGLLYCAEGKLDQALLRSPALYARYAGRLSRLLEEALPETVLAAAMAETRAELWSVLADEETAAAMVEIAKERPGLGGLAGVRAEIAARMAEVLAQSEARRSLLRSRLAAWRQETGR
jgi:hypothetical protein